MFFRYPNNSTEVRNLDWIIKHCNEFIESINSIDGWIEQHEKEYNDLKKIIDDFNNGEFTDDFIESLKSWIVNNVNDLISYAIKNVWFGLTDSGYFVAYIPDSWNDIIFNTIGYDIDVEDSVNYGRLVLSY